MRTKLTVAFLVLVLFGAVAAQAATLRVVVVETSDVAAYVKAIEQGRELLKSKGSPVMLRVWKARFAGDKAGSVVATAEYPSLEALAQDDARMKSDPEMKGWLSSMDRLRKLVSDSIYEEQTP